MYKPGKFVLQSGENCKPDKAVDDCVLESLVV